MEVYAYGRLTLTKVVFNLLNHLQVKVTRTSVSNALQNHPDYPSLLCISDVLKQWKVNSTAIKADKDNLHELPLPFIAHINTAQPTFITVTHINNTNVEYKSRGGGGGGKC